MRGKVRAVLNPDETYRITPAYAGKRSRHSLFRSKPEDHPRLCGEKPSYISQFFRKMGSPPPMRGKVPQRL